MNATGTSSGKPGIPVNRFALFAETILAGVIVLLLSVPLVTAPAAYAAGVAHLERHLSGRDDSLRSLWGNFRRALPGSWKFGITTAAAAVVIVLNLLLALVGQLPGRAVILPATLILAAAGAVLLLRTAANWSGGVNWDGDAGLQPAEVPGRQRWAAAYSSAKDDSVRDWSGSLLLLAALFMTVVFVWMLQALFVIVPGTLVLAAAAIKIRSHRS
ncbi:Poxvirus protein I5 [Paenarthrobacter sp. OM7]|uniref:Poxvirus protein I5 n=1 Tax=Paenarthrobacter sp. AMU7 TaxID=3162492 RepID=A0AB39YVZ4_9MICC|nr:MULTISPECIES: Poxvirus protein I5 [Micrococcaceae]WGM22785.1 Poxvirus protein I5 [Paenarthrobacter sp. OM7]